MMRLVARASLSTRMIVGALLSSLTVLVAAGVILSHIHRQATEQAFDERLNVYLQALTGGLASPTESDHSDPADLGDPKFDLPMSGWYWQIDSGGDGKGQTIASPSLFGSRLPRMVTPTLRTSSSDILQGYVKGPDDRNLRVMERMVLTPDGVWHRLRVAGDADDIERAVQAFRFPLLVTFGLLGATIVFLTALQVWLGMRPLGRLSTALSDIRTGQADRIDGDYPPDLAPLARELNLLIDSNREIMERARTQVGNLAHALKTPLSVIANEAAAIDGEVGEKIREQSAVIGTQMNWYLERARTAAASVALGRATELAPVIGGLARVFAKLWQSRAVTLVYDVPSGLCFRGEKQDLEEMLGNLIDNAGKWAASQVSVTARLNEGPELFVDVMIDDDGPGLAKDLRVEAMQRGRRIDETRPGTGLGLAIVADLAKLYGGQLMLEDSSLGGLRARLRLPALQSPS